MKKIGIFLNEVKDKRLEVTKLLVKSLTDRGVQALIPVYTAKMIGREDTGIEVDKLFSESEIILSLGGDGTFLRVARKACCLNTPILGINVGNLGFLAEVDRDDLDSVADTLIQGKYSVEGRMLLEVKVRADNYESEIYYALNEAVISRGRISRMINNIKVEVNDRLVDQFPADGVIVCTPTGSTAYSLSAGGPIVEPDMELMVITPICPHTLHSRSIVVDDRKKISIMIDDKNQNDSMLTVDGQESHHLTNKHEVVIKKSEKRLNIIRLENRCFFDVVRNKLFNRSRR